MRTEARIAPGIELRQGHRIFRAASRSVDALAGRTLRLHLSVQQSGQVAGVKTIPDLLAGAIEADITQRAAPQMRVDPVCKDPLVRCAELTGARQNATAIDPHRKPKGIAVLQGDG